MQFDHDFWAAVDSLVSSAKTPNQRKERIKKRGLLPPLNWIYFVSASIRRLSTSGRATE